MGTIKEEALAKADYTLKCDNYQNYKWSSVRVETLLKVLDLIRVREKYFSNRNFIKYLLLGKCFIIDILQSQIIPPEIFSVIAEQKISNMGDIFRVFSEIQELGKKNEEIKELLRDYLFCFISRAKLEVKTLNGVISLCACSDASSHNLEFFNYYSYVSGREKSNLDFDFMKFVDPNGNIEDNMEKGFSANSLCFSSAGNAFYADQKEGSPKVFVAYEMPLILECAKVLNVNVEEAIKDLKGSYGTTGIRR